MIIDAHHHLWDPADRPYPWMDDSVAPIRRRFDVDDLRAATTGTSVTRTIAVQAVHDAGETAWLLAQPAPVAGVVGWVDLTAPDVAERVAAASTGPGGERLVGVRHQAQDEPDPGWLARPEVVRGVRVVARAGLVFDLLVRAREHDAALALVDAVPEASFVLDHAGKPSIDTGDPSWPDRMRDFAVRPNVACKVSGLLTEAGVDWRDRPVARYARDVVEHFGPERSLFGSDWPVSTLAADYAEVLRTTSDALADLSPTERDAVLRGTAERIYLAGARTQT
ncbi:amidohydrolase family protein [Curtobacterium sp. SORGH_AS_0776]|uniref:amidohydrolase family protein n=1 Tax=Curtobacterium sp. SORGH_AS_0776 TaxID=3041798 RepID=UPI002857E249|nr:amidohydrolase family protein [Curtobacterium sp. SORGH_AS_0776]MDR6169231.1 putative TIM-barrel fold metal-dependent hydrolase [Curtobacterium sp. SORGH_AS_0776]